MTGKERGFLLLASQLGDRDCRPLSAAQLRSLAGRVQCMEKPAQDRVLLASDVMALGYREDMAKRILELLDREELLDHYLDRGRKLGCVPLTRVSPGYPACVRKRLGLEAPGCLWAKGDLTLLDAPKVALVGSRDILERNRRAVYWCPAMPGVLTERPRRLAFGRADGSSLSWRISWTSSRNVMGCCTSARNATTGSFLPSGR